MIESLTLKNFKGHSHLHVLFPSGLTLITGPNYSGKSSILHAILFAFWGVSAVPGGSKRITKRGEAASSTQVELQFHHRGYQYRIERKPASARLYRDGGLIATSLSGVTKELEQVVGMPTKFFHHLKYVEQGKTQALLTLGAAELHKVVDHVSGALVVSRVISKASALASHCSSAISSIGKVEGIEEREAEIAQQEAALAHHKQEIVRLTAANKEVGAALVEKWEALTQAKALNADLEAYDKAYEEMDSELQRLSQQEIAQGAQLAQLEPTVKGAEAKLSHAKSLRERAIRFDSERRRMSALQERLDAVYYDSGKKAKELAELEAKADEHPEAVGLEDATNRARELSYELKSLEKRHYELTEAIKQAVCHACGRPFDQDGCKRHEKELEEIADQYNSLEKEHEHLSAQIKKLSSQKSSRELWLGSLGKLRQALANLDSEAQGLLHDLDAVETSLEDLAPQELSPEALSQAEQAAAEAQQALGSYQTLTKALEHTRNRIDAISEDMMHLGGRPKGEIVDLSEHEAALTALLVQEATTKSELTSAASTVQFATSNLKTLRSGLEEQKSRARQLAELTARHGASSRLAKYLKGNRDRFLQELWAQIMGYAGGFASTCTGGAIQGVSRGDDGSFLFSEDGDWEIVETASGAQRSIMALGVQLALDTLLPDTLGALLLDEPNGSLDDEHSSVFVQSLANSNRQVIMVSHRQMDSCFAQAHIRLD